MFNCLALHRNGKAITAKTCGWEEGLSGDVPTAVFRIIGSRKTAVHRGRCRAGFRIGGSSNSSADHPFGDNCFPCRSSVSRPVEISPDRRDRLPRAQAHGRNGRRWTNYAEVNWLGKKDALAASRSRRADRRGNGPAIWGILERR
jgi:hypothetical protein